MSEGIYFLERQKFRQWWLWLILIAVGISFVVNQVIHFTESQNTAKTNGLLPILLYLLGIFLLYAFFWVCCLETKITQKGIHIRFVPFHRKHKLIRWEEIQSFEIRKYKSVREYGGYGIRYNFKKGKAYNVSGNTGLQLYLNKNRKILIGTQMPELLQKVLEMNHSK